MEHDADPRIDRFMAGQRCGRAGTGARGIGARIGHHRSAAGRRAGGGPAPLRTARRRAAPSRAAGHARADGLLAAWRVAAAPRQRRIHSGHGPLVGAIAGAGHDPAVRPARLAWRSAILRTRDPGARQHRVPLSQDEFPPSMTRTQNMSAPRASAHAACGLPESPQPCKAARRCCRQAGAARPDCFPCFLHRRRSP